MKLRVSTYGKESYLDLRTIGHTEAKPDRSGLLLDEFVLNITK
jgi:hypothetical protein